jgi:hypothetical protein
MLYIILYKCILLSFIYDVYPYTGDIYYIVLHIYVSPPSPYMHIIFIQVASTTKRTTMSPPNHDKRTSPPNPSRYVSVLFSVSLV